MRRFSGATLENTVVVNLVSNTKIVLFRAPHPAIANSRFLLLVLLYNSST